MTDILHSYPAIIKHDSPKVDIDIATTIPRIHSRSWDLKPGGECKCVAFSNDGIFFAWSAGYGIVKCVFNITSASNNQEKCLHEILSINNNVRVPVFEKSALENWAIKIDCGERIESMQFSNDKYPSHGVQLKTHLLATGLEKGKIKIWHPVNGELIYPLADHNQCVNGLSFACIGIPILASCSNDKTLKIWDLSDGGNMTLTLTGHKLPVMECAFNPTNHNMLCSVGKVKEVIIWKFNHGKSCEIVRHLHGHDNDVVSCAFSPDGALLATASRDTFVFVWDPFDGQLLIKLGHMFPPPVAIFAGGANGYWLQCVKFSIDGKRIATICEDNKVRVWSLFNDEPTIIGDIVSAGNKCAFSPDGSKLAIGKDDGTVSVICNLPGSVSSLCHLSRMSVRKKYSSTNVKDFILPDIISRFLQYRC